MKRRTMLQLAWGLAAPAVSGAAPAARALPALHWASRALNAMGTTMNIRVAHAQAEQGERALDAAVREIRLVEDLMSVFSSDSAVGRLNRGGVLARPHPYLLSVLGTAQSVAQRSGGAFDVTVQPLWELFSSAQSAGALPAPSEVRDARARVGWQRLQVHAGEVRLAAGMGVTLNGIAPGFAADRVRAALLRHGVQHAAIDTGEWSVLGRSPQGQDWALGVADPRVAGGFVARVAPHGHCLATSADNECTFSADFSNHHIFDPHTGYSPPELSCVSVLAPTCVLADALTKVLFMAGYRRALDVARAWKVQALVVRKDGTWRASPGFPLVAA